jgi:hypothetical protein
MRCTRYALGRLKQLIVKACGWIQCNFKRERISKAAIIVINLGTPIANVGSEGQMRRQTEAYPQQRPTSLTHERLIIRNLVTQADVAEVIQMGISTMGEVATTMLLGVEVMVDVVVEILGTAEEAEEIITSLT